MTLRSEFFTSGYSTFAGLNLSGEGYTISGNLQPQGIPGALFLRDGVMIARTTNSSIKTAGGTRSEIYFDSDPDGENWHCWEFMLPSQFWNGWAGNITIGQCHETDKEGDPPSREIPLSFQYRDGMGQIVMPGCPMPTNCFSSKRISAVKLECDRWYSLVMHVKWSYDVGNIGFREVFLNRRPIFREWNVATTYVEDLPPFFKLGIYVTNSGVDAGDKELYVRNLRNWSGIESYENVMGGPPIVPG